MKKLVKIKDNKIISVFMGTDINYAKNKGYQEYEVEQGYDGDWYLEGCVPEKPIEEINAEKIEEYKKYLADTDYIIMKIAEATTEDDTVMVNELKEKYADVLEKRNGARENINILEKENGN